MTMRLLPRNVNCYFTQAADLIAKTQVMVVQNKDAIVGAIYTLDYQSLSSGFSSAVVAIQALSDSVAAASNGTPAWSASAAEDKKITTFGKAFNGLARRYVDVAVKVGIGLRHLREIRVLRRVVVCKYVSHF